MKVKETDIYITQKQKSLFSPGLYDKTTCFSGTNKSEILWEKQFFKSQILQTYI